MDWNKWVRQIHRWLSIAFTVAVIVNIVAVGQGEYAIWVGLLALIPLALGQGEYAIWVGLLALIPLALLLFTGLYLFVLPYGTEWRRGWRTGEAVLE